MNLNTSINRFQRKIPNPPGELGKDGRKLWRSILEQYSFDDAGGLAHLYSACRSEDSIVTMLATVAAEGTTILNRKGDQVAHPLLAQIRGLETVKRQSLRSLNLDMSAPAKIGRPPGRPNSK